MLLSTTVHHIFEVRYTAAALVPVYCVRCYCAKFWWLQFNIYFKVNLSTVLSTIAHLS